MILIILSFFIGIIALCFFREVPGPALLSAMVIPPLLMSSFSFFNKYRIYVLAFLLGFLWMLWNAEQVLEQRIPSSLEGRAITAVGVVDSVPEWQEKTLSFKYKIKYLTPNALWPKPGIVKIYWKEAPRKLQVGDEWQLVLKLKQPHGLRNPGGFDEERMLFQNRIVAKGSVINSKENSLLKSDLLSHPVDRLRSFLAYKINMLLKNKPYAGIITALVIGIQSGIKEAQWNVLRNTGTLHLVAISGLHIGLSAGFMYFLVALYWRYFSIHVALSKQKVSGILALITAFIYTLLAGFSVPTQRALIMISIFMLAIFCKRIFSPWLGFSIALGIVLLLDPLSILSPGFWLSFGAVAILLYGMKGRLNPKSLWWRWGRAQWVVFLGLTPLTFMLFGTGSFISPIANMIAIPWISFLVVPCGLLGTFCLFISETLGNHLLLLAEYFISLLWPVLVFLSDFPILKASFFPVDPFTWIIPWLGILLCLMPRGFPGKIIGIFLILPLLFFKPDPVPENHARVIVLDVGQGLSAIIETQHHVLVFDTGPKTSPKTDAGERVVLPFLASRGIQEIDILLISHGDNDHAGGAKAILKALNVKQILSSEPELFKNLNTKFCKASQHWEWDGVKFDILHPGFLTSRKRNDHSCVLKVSAGDQSFLLTGDIETHSEKMIQQLMPHKLKSTVMLVPHHGSKTSSSMAFIQAVKPTFAIFTVGYRNAYQHPKPEIVARYQKEGVLLLDSVHDGAISFVLNPEQKTPILSRFRKENRRFWHST